MSQPFIIQQGLPEGCRHEAAALYYAAFRRKFEPFLSPQTKGLALIATDFNPAFGFVALSGEQLVGIAGIQYGGEHFLAWREESFVAHYGPFWGRLRYHSYRLFLRPQVAGQLLMDGIAVHADYRSHGVGSALIKAICTFAAENGFREVRLDVVDSNPRARQLYERLGFEATSEHRYPFLRPLFGFAASTTMIKKIGRSTLE